MRASISSSHWRSYCCFRTRSSTQTQSSVQLADDVNDRGIKEGEVKEDNRAKASTKRIPISYSSEPVPPTSALTTLVLLYSACSLTKVVQTTLAVSIGFIYQIYLEEPEFGFDDIPSSKHIKHLARVLQNTSRSRQGFSSNRAKTR